MIIIRKKKKFFLDKIIISVAIKNKTLNTDNKN